MNAKIGLQIWALREDFVEEPYETLKKIKAMGYTGVELVSSKLTKSASEYRAMLDEIGLECYGLLTGYKNLSAELLPETMELCRALGTDNIVIGSINFSELSESPDAPVRIVKELCDIHDTLLKAGFNSGYHNHDSDFKNTVGDKSFFEFVLENTPDSFLMVLDTGNAVAGGGDPVALMKKYGNRAKIIHLKGYSEENKYLAPVWDCDYGIDEIVELALNNSTTEYIDIEFGARGEYDPTERAARSAKWLAAIEANA